MQKTILIVDDEEMVVDIMKRKFSQEGFLPIGVYDGEAALKVIKEGSVDLIILDVEMPKLNGYAFLNECKKIPESDHIPVIVVTAYASMEPIFRRNGVVEYLTKPLRFQDLLTKVRSVLDAQDDKK